MLLVAGEEDGAERFMLVNGCLCVVVFVFLVGKFVCLMTVGLGWLLRLLGLACWERDFGGSSAYVIRGEVCHS